MNLSIGDQIVHPVHGAGQISAEEQLDLVKGFERYYVIDFIGTDVVVHVPVRKMAELGLRPVMPGSRLARVRVILSGAPEPLAKNPKLRQTQIREKLNTGCPLKIAEVVRDLSWRKMGRTHLSPVDAGLLAWSRELLETEIAAITGTTICEARQNINALLFSAMASDTLERP